MRSIFRQSGLPRSEFETPPPQSMFQDDPPAASSTMRIVLRYFRLGNSKIAETCELVEHLAREGFDACYGARPLQRTLETLIVTPLARFLLANPELNGRALKLTLGPSGGVEFRIMWPLQRRPKDKR